MTPRKFIPHFIGAFLVALLTLGASGDGPLAAQRSLGKLHSPGNSAAGSANPAEYLPSSAPPDSLARPVGKIPAPPLARLGESLEYRIAWSTFSGAATVKTEVAAQGAFFGGHGLHLRAEAHTQAPVRTLFPVDDQFDSYDDAATLETRQYEMYLRELGRESDAKFRLAPQVPAASLPAPGPVVVVPSGTRDPLSALFWLRSVDWDRTPEVRSPVYDGRNIYELLARNVDAEKITIPAGSFPATRIALTILRDGQPLSGLQFTIWLARNAGRTPLRIDANLPFGSLRADLASPPHP